MKIAVAYENGQIFQHFGHTEQFKLYEAVDGKITHAKVVDTNGSGHGALAGFQCSTVWTLWFAEASAAVRRQHSPKRASSSTAVSAGTLTRR